MSDKFISLGKHALDVVCEESSVCKSAKLDDCLANSTRGLKNCAIIMVYSGWGYYGMQKNDGFATIEGDLLAALQKAGYITKDQALVPSIIQFQRASKTDKNVSAAGQVCKAKLPFGNGISMDLINENLPDQIRVLDIFRVTKRFCPKNACDHRVYQYLVPTFALGPRDMPEETCWQYRLPADRLTLANNMFLYYKGTHNYFNFTSRRTANDMSCQRYIMSIECGTPFLLANDKEFALITICGQSFMLHQIRKMIGLVIAIVKGYTSEVIFETAFKTERIDIPKAPGLGLLLAKVDFSRYNERFCADGSHQPIDWEKYQAEIEIFKEAHIYRHMVEKEIEEKSMLTWLQELNRHTYDARLRELLVEENTGNTFVESPTKKSSVSSGGAKPLQLEPLTCQPIKPPTLLKSEPENTVLDTFVESSLHNTSKKSTAANTGSPESPETPNKLSKILQN